MNLGEKIVDHIPDILQISGMIGAGLACIGYIDAGQKDYRDGNKKAYIWPSITLGVSELGLFLSGKEHHNAEAILAATAAGLLAKNAKQTKALEDHGIKDLTTEDSSSNDISPFDEDKKTCYYLSDYGGYHFWGNDKLVNGVENQVNKEFYNQWQIVTLEDIFERLGVGGITSEDRKILRNVTHTPIYNSDEAQGICFQVTPMEGRNAKLRILICNGSEEEVF